MDEQIYEAVGQLYLQNKLELAHLRKQAHAAIEEQRQRAEEAERALSEALSRVLAAEKARDEALHLLAQRRKGE